MSCGNKEEKESSHCGVCLPCTIRRAAILKAGLQDESFYRDPKYKDIEAETNLRSYKLGLTQNKYPLLAIYESGPITHHRQEFAELYQRGLKELADFINTL